jgi:hypothetical protein
MDHAPFIAAAYSIAVVLLTWCALVPVFSGRRLKRSILTRIEYTEDKDAPDA